MMIHHFWSPHQVRKLLVNSSQQIHRSLGVAGREHGSAVALLLDGLFPPYGMELFERYKAALM